MDNEYKKGDIVIYGMLHKIGFYLWTIDTGEIAITDILDDAISNELPVHGCAYYPSNLVFPYKGR